MEIFFKSPIFSLGFYPVEFLDAWDAFALARGGSQNDRPDEYAVEVRDQIRKERSERERVRESERERRERERESEREKGETEH